MNDNHFCFVVFHILFWGALGGLALTQCSGGCDDIPASVRAPDAAGIDHVSIGEHSVMGCGKDWSSREFKGRNQQGKPVEGVVCCGLLKGCTVRW